METTKPMMTVMLIFLLYVASSLGKFMNARDKLAVMAVRDAIENKESFPEIVCQNYWFGCDSSGRVTQLRLYLPWVKLKGRIAPEIGNLTKLEYLWLWDNEFSGSIPSSIGNLTSLFSLYLSYNKLSGGIPSSFGNLKSLTYLRISNNQLSGRIPSSLGNLKSLIKFEIENNYFTGPIVQVNKHPLCYELEANCLFGPSLPKGCESGAQRSKSTCLSFCNATQVGGPCGGNGRCSLSTDGKTSTCACYRGYNKKASKYTCKFTRSLPSRKSTPPPQKLTPPPRKLRPPPRKLAPLRSPHRSPPPRPRKPTPPSPAHRLSPPRSKPPVRAVPSPPSRRPPPSKSSSRP